MTIIETFTVRMPTYALSYIINNDESGLTWTDIANIDAYIRQYEKIAESLHAHIYIETTNESEYFTWKPAFGLACTVQDTNIIILKDDPNQLPN